MDARRRRYLDAMGIQRWVGREAASPSQAFDAVGERPNAGGQARLGNPLPGSSGFLSSQAEDSRRSRQPPTAQEAGASGQSFPNRSLGSSGSTDLSREAASGESAGQWQALQAQVAGCMACSLHQTRTQTVFGVGNRRADWLLIGEAPGEQEDLKGEPFVGRAGQLLNEMLRAVGQGRDEVFIANILKCRPPGNRDPKPEEAAACESYLRRQVELIRPKIILSVGRISAQNLLKTDAPVGRLRGRVHRYGDIPLVVVYHPAYLLRSPTEKRKAWDDLRLALKTYRETLSAPAEQSE